MIRSRPLAVLCLLALVGQVAAAPSPEQIQVLLRNRPELDLIRWKDPARGAPLNVRIVQADARTITVDKSLPAGLTTRAIPHAELEGISFRFTPREAALHRAPTSESASALRVYWEARRATLRIPGSNVGETGLALARSLRLSADTKALDEADEVLDAVRSQDLSPPRIERARAEQSIIAFLRASASGKTPETDAIAWQITEHPDNHDGMILATAYLAGRHFAELKVIDEENPRWIDDDEIRPVRQRLHHLALDFALYPSLFLPTRETEAANGLRLAAEIHQFTRAPLLAKNTLEDLAALYPESAAARETAPELAKLRAREAAGKLTPGTADPSSTDDDTKATEDADDGTPSGPPPPPKRYNIFGD